MGASKRLFMDTREEESNDTVYECTVCGREMERDSGVCSNTCFKADMM